MEKLQGFWMDSRKVTFMRDWSFSKYRLCLNQLLCSVVMALIKHSAILRAAKTMQGESGLPMDAIVTLDFEHASICRTLLRGAAPQYDLWLRPVVLFSRENGHAVCTSHNAPRDTNAQVRVHQTWNLLCCNLRNVAWACNFWSDAFACKRKGVSVTKSLVWPKF